MTCGVYEIVNKETNQSYIGRSINIENRWVGHKNSPTNNMLPTIELYNSCPEMVEFNIIREFDEDIFEKSELQFLLSISELFEVNKRGGWDSDNLINGKDIDLKPCPPSILNKKEQLPDYIDDSDLIYGIIRWWNSYDSHIVKSWYDEYQKNEELKESMVHLNNVNSNLKRKIRELENESEYSKQMKVDYEYFKLKKENAILSDEKEELESNVLFWKEKAHHWREEYFLLSQKRLPKKSESKQKKEVIIYEVFDSEVFNQIKYFEKHYSVCWDNDLTSHFELEGYGEDAVLNAVNRLIDKGYCYRLKSNAIAIVE